MFGFYGNQEHCFAWPGFCDQTGMGQSGLFYYYHLFAKALDAMKVDLLTDDKGVEHDWRKELAAHLISIQKPNGSWVNSEKRWMEGDPNLSTAFALMTLAYCEERARK